MHRYQKKLLGRSLLALPAVAGLLYLAPIPVGLWLICGFVDVLRNRPRSALLFSRYFFGNGLLTWALAPVNLLTDLLCRRNRGIYTPADLPPAWRADVDAVLGVFQQQRERIIADIDAAFQDGRRGMYIYQWYGKRYIDNIPELTRDYRYLKTIAVSVFRGRESTTWHFGPLRFSLRVLFNLTPVESDQVYIECMGRRHVWRDNPLYIFDDTLLHRSVNEYDAKRYCVFMDIVRPSPWPGVPSVLLFMMRLVSVLAKRINRVFYKHWNMIARRTPASPAPPATPTPAPASPTPSAPPASNPGA